MVCTILHPKGEVRGMARIEWDTPCEEEFDYSPVLASYRYYSLLSYGWDTIPAAIEEAVRRYKAVGVNVTSCVPIAFRPPISGEYYLAASSRPSILQRGPIGQLEDSYLILKITKG